VLRALRGSDAELTVIVAAAEYAGPGPPPEHGAEAVADLRRSLEALSGDEVALARALRRPLTIDRSGCHPLGNLLLQSLASAFGDLGTASVWLGTQLGITGCVVPATAEPLKAPDLVAAITRQDLVLLAPGSVTASVLVASAIPGIRDALRVTPAPVVWICNLRSEGGETVDEQLASLRRHDIRVDAILYDPHAGLGLEAGELREPGVAAIARRLMGGAARTHDPELLCAAVADLFRLGVPRAGQRQFQHRAAGDPRPGTEAPAELLRTRPDGAQPKAGRADQLGLRDP
jgi:hypothetical protein